MDKAINIIELAKILNISKSTVSRAFRNNSDINPKTKELILAKAKELNYQPNIYASNLRDSKSSTIAIVIPELANNFFSQAVKGIEKITNKHNFHILVYVTDSNYENERKILLDLQNGRVDGIIMSATGEGKNISYIKDTIRKKLPIVFFDRVYNEIEAPKVLTNDYDSSFQATNDLIDAGCKKIAFFVINKDISIGNHRLHGYLDALKSRHITPHDSWILECDNDREISYHIIKKFLENEKPDGILTAVERLSVVTYRVCLNTGINIPKDIKLIGFSCLEIADLLNPSMSIIQQPAYEMGQKAAQLLFASMKIGSPKITDPITLKSTIIHRRSSATD